ncbi:C40 family peptidase [Paenibacillus alkaliterrae]|uniref:C40 family peptidase n=1 Tax=Paenibacillus alkaliterrae TaxID=320909 RepID=UPI001F202808|nr:C40 family peptidase [Paenibacillus alkaliterrae]MCF2941452.1 C40 family peptidase [Paenibacillus alkaliterrae]
MKKIFASVLVGAMCFSFAGSTFANGMDMKHSVDEVVGTPYKWGGTTVKGFDCSGFILYVFNQYNVDLPRTSKAQAQKGTKIAQKDLLPGDLVFFNTNGRDISHAGIYIGNGQFAHSSSSKGVRISKLTENYYEKRYVTARRVVSKEAYSEMSNKEH